ncbi:MAG: sugar ABC transporter permease [Paracoccaceae bacterium]|nr:sugar ABC transporter permease [Paracoccaceae bacterium]MDE3240370.1 sugar ABC transporter permease [Paracoccaceae bacterium]
MPSRGLPYLLLMPAAIFLAVFFLYPFTLVAWEAFSGADGGLTLAHFATMAGNWKFSSALENTLLLAIAVVPIQTAMALAMAVLVTKIQRGRDVVLYIFTIPLGISDLAAGLIWFAIFDQTGFLNSALHTLGVVKEPVIWLGYQNRWVIFLAVMLAEIWRATAIMLVILVAGLGLIPKEYSEAAEVFGAGPWQRFRRVTLPLLRPSLQTALILRTILAFEVFAVVYALGGNNLPILMGQTFHWQFDLQDYHVAAALAMVILGISIGFTLVLLRVLRVPKGAGI